MVRWKSLMLNCMSSRNMMYVLVIICLVYFTRDAPQETSATSRYSQMRMMYDPEHLLQEGEPINDKLQVEQDIFAMPQQHIDVIPMSEAKEHDEPKEVTHIEISNNQDTYGGFQSSQNNPSVIKEDAEISEEEYVATKDVQAHHDPRFTSEQEHEQHSKSSREVHFASSHQKQVGQGQMITDDKHGTFVPHTYISKSKSHEHIDPYYSMHIRETEIEKMKATLPKLLPNYRNPCWVEHLPRGFSYFEHTLYYQYYKAYPNAQPHRDWERTYDKLDHLIQVRKKKTKDGKSWRLRCFPYFFLIGFTRAGTTDLWRSMSLLPEFVRGLIKEPKFWNKVRLHNYAENLPNATLSDYLDLYDGVAEVIRGFSRKMPDGNFYHPGITADMDPQTIWKLPKWQHIKGNQERDSPKFTTADHLHALKPDSKLIVMMRDPVERAFSHYCFFKTRKKYATKSELADKFHHDMVKATTKLIRCFKQRGPKSCAYQPPRYNALAMRSLTVSMYAVFINDWLKVFPKGQFLFIKSEDYFANRVKTIKEVSHFLQIDDTIHDSLVESIQEFRVMNPSTKTGMHRETRELLRDFFRPFNRKLTHMLKNDIYQWDY